MFSTGIVLAIVRLFEPFFMFLLKQKVWMCFGIYIDEQKEGIKTDTLSTFLASSLNVELVHIILKGIKKFSNVRIDESIRNSETAAENQNNPNFVNTSRTSTMNENYQLMRVCRLNRIKIKNPEKWDKAKYDDFVGNQFKNDEHVHLVRQGTYNQYSSFHESSQGSMHSQNSLKSHKSIKKKKSLSKSITKSITMNDQAQTMLTINEEVTIFEYAPKTFQEIRDMDNIDSTIIKKSLSAKLNRDQAFQAGESQGKSGSFFFFSHDRRFIIKTMYDHELSIFLKALSDYGKHLENNPDSLLARIYGVFKVKMEDIVPVNLILMANTIRCKSSLNIMNIFDLKGSMVNREVKWSRKLKNTSTLKDINLQKIKKQN